MRWGVLVTGGMSLLLAVPPALASEAPGASDDLTGLIREACGITWIDELCASHRYEDPGYAVADEPHPELPLEWRVGVVHEHSGYSDGDPDTRPADYFEAARTGHNRADDGSDTGVIVDYLLSSEHSDNEKLPVTTAEVCIDPSGIPDALAALDLEGAVPPLRCSNVERGDHHDKWDATLDQARSASQRAPSGTHDGFTAMRGFEWTNDYYNHLGVYFSRNVVNAKIDGSYLGMDAMWGWLREPVSRGGGADALVVFNHPGGNPALTPFDGGLPHGELLQQLRGGANWDDLAYVPDVDERVVGIEVNGGDDLSWYVRALTRGWHLGPVAAEDEHQREWSTTADGKTLVLTRGRSPGAYYRAFAEHRTVALAAELIGGRPGQPATHPTIQLYAGADSIDHPAATLLGSTLSAPGAHQIRLEATGLPAGSEVVLVSNAIDQPAALGTAGADGAIAATRLVTAPTAGEHWWFAVVCPPGTTDCGPGESYSAVTAPIWFRAAG